MKNSLLIIFVLILLSVALEIFVLELSSHEARKPVFWVSDKASLKPVPSAKQARMKIDIFSHEASLGMILLKKQATKLLMRLRGCAG